MLSPVNDTPESIELKAAIARDKRWLAMGVVGFVVVVAMVVGVAFFQKTQQIGQPENSESQMNQVAREPEKTAEPVTEQQSYKVEILNGSGVTGAAGSAKAELESRFKNQNSSVEITTGNGTAQTGTTIEYKNDALRRSRLAGVLSELYPAAKASVDDTLVADVRVVLGK